MKKKELENIIDAARGKIKADIVIKNGKIFGRGASDMKTAIAAYISSVSLFL